MSILALPGVTNLGLKAEASGTEGGATRLGAPPLPEGKWLPHRGSSVAAISTTSL
ncbi:MAG: hypothetical protein NTX79_08330 [Candidatus Micrarchaeota archaeon]|nr:hypothetical protein [Candidatus Micrarchaeota archaeon]